MLAPAIYRAAPPRNAKASEKIKITKESDKVKGHLKQLLLPHLTYWNRNLCIIYNATLSNRHKIDFVSGSVIKASSKIESAYIQYD